MITLKCTTSVIMTDGSVAFKAGESYQFHLKSNGDIRRFHNNTVHIFYCVGEQAWTNYFKYEIEE